MPGLIGSGYRHLHVVRTQGFAVHQALAALQFHEDHMCGRVADVVSVMLLCWQPPSRACLHLDVTMALTGMQAAAKGTQGVHHAVGVFVRRGLVARTILIFQHPYLLVLEDNLVVIRVRYYGIERHRGLCFRASE